MLESRKTVFISCGQFTEEEKHLGSEVCELVAQLTPFVGYFAQNQTSLEALSENILTRLYNSAGLIVIMHHRGKIEGHGITRASVWVEQEVAMATLMQQVLRRPLYAKLFTQRGISLEGLRKYIQFNAVEFTRSEEVIAELHKILPTWKEPLYIGDEEKRALVEAADISVKVQNGFNLNITILVANHSTFDVEIKNVVFRSKRNRLCSPILPPPGLPWKVPVKSSIPFQMTSDEDISMRLASIHDQFFKQERFLADVEIELQCEILSMKRTVRDERTVQVETRGHQIIGV
jgi:hypothetical protein